METRLLRVEVNETNHAHNVNGVTFSKRILREIMPNWGDDAQALYRLLVIMPFLAQTKDPEDTPTKAGKYTVLKCRRIYEAIGLEDEAVAPFMLMAANMGKLDPKDFSQVSDELHDAICNCGEAKTPKGNSDNVIRGYFGAGKTLH